MTDAEIIKALSVCKNETYIKCPLYKQMKSAKCLTQLTEDALNLINRQKAEIENCVDALCKKEDMMKFIAEERQQYYDELQIAKAEIERLQSILLKFVREINNFENKHNIDTSDFSLIPILEEEKNNLVKQIKAEAIKEFEERLNEEIREILKDAYYERRKRIENLEQEHIFVGLDAVAKYYEGKIHSSDRMYRFIGNLVKEMVGDT